jgi:type IV fimbrial biogenesis protein FimT
MEGPNKRQRGFTLAELVTTLAVVSISTSLAVPGMQSLMQDSQRVADINELVTTMHRARSEAITRNVDVVVCPGTAKEGCGEAEWSEGWLVFADPDRNRQPGAGEDLIYEGPGLEDLTAESEEFDRFFVYRPDGHLMVDNPENNTGRFTFCDPNGTGVARTLIVQITGQPRLAEQQPDSPDPVCDDG